MSPARDYPLCPEVKFLRSPYNKSCINQTCSVKIAGFWPRSFLAFLRTSTPSRSMNTQKKELGQYTAILTSHLINNPYISACKFWYKRVHSFQFLITTGIYWRFRQRVKAALPRTEQWEVRWSLIRTVRVRALARVIAFCSWARMFSHSASVHPGAQIFSSGRQTQVNKLTSFNKTSAFSINK